MGESDNNTFLLYDLFAVAFVGGDNSVASQRLFEVRALAARIDDLLSRHCPINQRSQGFDLFLDCPHGAPLCRHHHPAVEVRHRPASFFDIHRGESREVRVTDGRTKVCRPIHSRNQFLRPNPSIGPHSLGLTHSSTVLSSRTRMNVGNCRAFVFPPSEM